MFYKITSQHTSSQSNFQLSVESYPWLHFLLSFAQWLVHKTRASLNQSETKIRPCNHDLGARVFLHFRWFGWFWVLIGSLYIVLVLQHSIEKRSSSVRFLFFPLVKLYCCISKSSFFLELNKTNLNQRLGIPYYNF